MLILYAGDSPAGGPANYLLGILKSLKAQFVHVPPSARFRSRWLRERFDAVILSDYSRKMLPRDSEKILAAQVRQGTGLLMIGGWGSFSGPFGGWKNSEIESLLPVRCSKGDDRMNFPGGAAIFPKKPSSLFSKFGSGEMPVICGMNRIVPKKEGEVLFAARKFKTVSAGGRLKQGFGAEFPLLVRHRKLRTAAFATDAAPHWCGGLVDWGSRSVKIKVREGIVIEVGNQYVGFFQTLIRWLAGKAS